MTNVDRSTWDKNVHGYSRSMPFIPPITKPVTVLDFMDKFMLTLAADASYVQNQFDIEAFVQGVNGEGDDGFAYLNAKAAGA